MMLLVVNIHTKMALFMLPIVVRLCWMRTMAKGIVQIVVMVTRAVLQAICLNRVVKTMFNRLFSTSRISKIFLKLPQLLRQTHKLIFDF